MKYFFEGLIFYYLTGLIVLAGGMLGDTFIVKSSIRGEIFDGGTGAFFVNWDGQWYKNIADSGYFYTPTSPSSVAFFPAYPMAARVLARATHLNMDLALLLVANLSLLATFILSALYFDARYGASDLGSSGYALLALGMMPTTFFLRMAYSDSLFLLLVTLLLVGMHNKWPLAMLAAIVGLSTATRAAGISLTPAFAYHVWTRHPEARSCAIRLVGLVPVSIMGLLLYMLYLYNNFGDPLAFVKSQIYWNIHPNSSAWEKVRSIAILQPVWCRFDPTSPSYWSVYDHHDMPFFSLYLADPFYFLSAAGLVIFGARKGWLTANEMLVAAGLFAMPIIFKFYDTNMVGFGRYAATIPPVYIVLGKILRHLPAPIAACLLTLGAAGLTIYTALFASWFVLL